MTNPVSILTAMIESQTADLRAEYIALATENAAAGFDTNTTVGTTGMPRAFNTAEMRANADAYLQMIAQFRAERNGGEIAEQLESTFCRIALRHVRDRYYAENERPIEYSATLTKAGRNYQTKWDRIANKGRAAFIASAQASAALNFAAVTEKFAFRAVEHFGINPETAVLVRATVAGGISITITDGAKTVRGFTIMAGGPVQTLHFRYLIKGAKRLAK